MSQTRERQWSPDDVRGPFQGRLKHKCTAIEAIARDTKFIEGITEENRATVHGHTFK